MIRQFTPQTIPTIMDECREALEVVAKKHGLSLQRKTCRYRPDEAPVAFRLLVLERTEEGDEIDPKETEFRRYAAAFGLTPDDFGKTFKVQGDSYQISGIKPRGRRYNVLGKSASTGKVYKFEVSAVLGGLARHQTQGV